MDTATKKEFEKLATSVAEGFSEVQRKSDQGFSEVRADIRELRSEIKSIRREIEELPDHIDRMYAGTINDILERVEVIEKHLGIAK